MKHTCTQLIVIKRYA